MFTSCGALSFAIRMTTRWWNARSPVAARDDISVNQFIASAVAEKMASILTLDYLRQEAAQGKRSDFERYLRAVPDAPPAAGDEPVS